MHKHLLPIRSGCNTCALHWKALCVGGILLAALHAGTVLMIATWVQERGRSVLLQLTDAPHPSELSLLTANMNSMVIAANVATVILLLISIAYYDVVTVRRTPLFATMKRSTIVTLFIAVSIVFTLLQAMPLFVHALARQAIIAFFTVLCVRVYLHWHTPQDRPAAATISPNAAGSSDA